MKFAVFLLALFVVVIATEERPPHQAPTPAKFTGFVDYVRSLMSPTNAARIAKESGRPAVDPLPPANTESVRERLIRQSIDKDERI
jgi:hypothetical protein